MDVKNDTIETVDQFDFWVGSARLDAQVFLPKEVRAAVMIAYSGVEARTEAYVYDLARELRRAGFGTVLVDGLPDTHRGVDATSHLRPFLSGVLRNRLIGAMSRLSTHEELSSLSLGCLGLGICAGPAIGAADSQNSFADAVVTFGGRPAEALEWTDEIATPTLMLRESAGTDGGFPDERSARNFFDTGHATVQLQSVQPPFATERAHTRLVNLTTNWFVDQLLPRPLPTPDLDRSIASPSFGLPPSSTLRPHYEARRAEH